MEGKPSVMEQINSNPSRTGMTLFALVLGVISAASFYLFDSLVYPLIGDPAPEEWRRPITTSTFFGGLTFVGVLFWAGVGRFVDEHVPELRDDLNKKKTGPVALTLGVSGTLLLYLFDRFALPLIGGDPLLSTWKQPVIASMLTGTFLFDVALYGKGLRRIVERKLSDFCGDRG